MMPEYLVRADSATTTPATIRAEYFSSLKNRMKYYVDMTIKLAVRISASILKAEIKETGKNNSNAQSAKSRSLFFL